MKKENWPANALHPADAGEERVPLAHDVEAVGLMELAGMLRDPV